LFIDAYRALTGRLLTEKDRKIAMIAFIFGPLPIVVGLILYFEVRWDFFFALRSGEAMADTCKLD